MSKKKNEKKKEAEVKPLVFIMGTMRDGVLDYNYEIKAGIGVGHIHKVRGKGIFDDDLSMAFSKLNVHLAAIDDVFKHADIVQQQTYKLSAFRKVV